MKKILSLALVFIVVLSSFWVYATENENEECVKSMVVVGDFLSTGYGLVTERESEANESEKISYADAAAKKLGLVKDETYFNYSKNETASADLLAYLCGELSEKELESFKGADAVVVTVGMNDLVGAILPKISIALGLEESASPADVSNALAKIEEKNLENALNELKTIYEKGKADFDALTVSYGENISASVKKINELSPNAQVFVVNVYDPFSDLSQYALVKTLRATLTTKIASEMNEKLTEAAKNEGFYIVDADTEFKGRKKACISADSEYFCLTELGHSILSDTLVYRVATVYDEIYDSVNGIFSDPEDIWIWFTFAVAIVVIAIPIVSFVAKKSKR